MHAYPAGHLFYRNLTRPFPEIVSGEGCWLTDADGKRYLDAVGGAFVASLGHGNAEIAEAVAAQARRIAYVNGTAFTTAAAEETSHHRPHPRLSRQHAARPVGLRAAALPAVVRRLVGGRDPPPRSRLP